MIQRRQTLKNAVMAVTQVVVTGVLLFFLYFYLVRAIGVIKFGVWSLVLATASSVRVGEVGLSRGIVKFVAQYLARGEPQKASAAVQTAALAITSFVAVGLAIAYMPLTWLLDYVVSAEALPDALGVLPYALASLWLVAVGAVFQSALDGCQRIDLRGLIVMATAGQYLLLVVILVPEHGLMGVAYAHVVQAGTALLVSWLVLRRQLSVLPLVPCQWHHRVFREMIGYSVNIQIISMTQLLFEPVTKVFLSKFGDLAMVGYYEMANRLVGQVRKILVFANEVLVPVIARLKELAVGRIRIVYRESYQLLWYLSLPLYGAVAAALPVISELWLGHYEATFVVFAVFLTVGWFLNTLVSAAYFTNLGTGRLRWNTLAHVVIGLLNGCAGYWLGTAYGGVGVVAGFVLALVFGSSVVVLAYHSEQRLPVWELLPEEGHGLALATGLGVVLAWFVYFSLREWANALAVGALSVVSFTTLILFPVWRHPLRTRLQMWVSEDLLKSAAGS